MNADSATADLNVMCCGGLDLKAISENATILEEGLKLCPLCQSEIKYIFISFNFKMLMCENTECAYPFGYEKPEDIFFKVEHDLQFDDDMPIVTSPAPVALTSTCFATDTESIFSELMFSETSRTRTNVEFKPEEAEETHDISAVCDEVKQNKNNKYTKLNENKITKQKFNSIKKLNKELLQMNKPSMRCLKNEKWLKKLMQMQSYNGYPRGSLLRPGEVKFLKETKSVLELGELAINVDTSQSNVPSITVALSEHS